MPHGDIFLVVIDSLSNMPLSKSSGDLTVRDLGERLGQLVLGVLYLIDIQAFHLLMQIDPQLI
jgi:hypothetical protein